MGGPSEIVHQVGEVALVIVETDEEAHDAVLDDQRHADFADKRVLCTQAALLLRESGVAQALDHHQLPSGERFRLGRPVADIVRPAHEFGGVGAGRVAAGDKPQRVALERVDLGTAHLRSPREQLRHFVGDLVEVACPGDQGAQFDEVVERAVALLHPLDEGSVLVGVCGHPGETHGELEIGAEIVRLRILELDHADHLLADDHRDGEQPPVAVLREHSARGRRQVRVVDVAHDLRFARA